jgi:hypothetical protein
MIVHRLHLDSQGFLMLKGATFTRNFAVVSILFAAAHFALEILYTLQFGQTFLGLLPDLVAVTLLAAGSYFLIKDRHATGVICGAWGFTVFSALPRLGLAS